MPSTAATAALLERIPHVWRADALARSGAAIVPSGHPALDAQLPGGGWPEDGMVEILQQRAEQHVWRLLLPALVAAIQAHQGPVVLVGAPFEPFVPSLAQQGLSAARLLRVRADKPQARLWAAEQAMRCAEVAAVLAWLPQARSPELRRIHIAAQQQQRLLFVFRDPAAAQQASPAGLRLLVGGTDPIAVQVFKRRGPPLEAPVHLGASNRRLQALLQARRHRGEVQPQVAGAAQPPFAGQAQSPHAGEVQPPLAGRTQAQHAGVAQPPLAGEVQSSPLPAGKAQAPLAGEAPFQHANDRSRSDVVDRTAALA